MDHSAPFMRVPDAAPYLNRPDGSDWSQWANHASALYATGKTRPAEIAARRAVRCDRNPATLLNLAVILETQSRFAEALPLAAAAFEADPSSGLAQCLYSDALLRTGRFSEAWPLYVHSHGDWSWVSHVLPEWNGHDNLRGKRLLVLSAGGYGDSILFARWLPFLQGLGAHVTLMCPKSLALLLAPLVDRVISGSIAGLDDTQTLFPCDYDLFASGLSLGGYFCPAPSDIPPTPYLAADPELAIRRQMELRPSGTPLIGICTRAGEETFPRRHRTLNHMQTARLLTVKTPATWVNLNYDDDFFSGAMLNPDIRDWSDTAAILVNLDLVVTVDTGVAHLAGALDVPCWVILPGLSAAYYGITGERSAFYASQRIFRNGGEGLHYSVSAACAALADWRPRAA